MKQEATMNKLLRSGLATLAILGGMSSVFAEETATEEPAEEKVRKITFIQDDAQFDMVSKIYTLQHTKAADLAPFVKSAVIRFNPVSTVSRLEDKANKRQLLIVTTAQDMMPYIDEMVEALDRESTVNASGSNISGTGIAYGSYKPQFRAAESMRKVIVGGQVASSSEDAKVKLDSKTNLFYFKDTPYRVEDIKQKLAWLDKEVPLARIELKIYEVRDSDLRDVGLDYLAWKNGPGLNIFSAGYEAVNMKVSETLFSQLIPTGEDAVGKVSYGFGGMYAAPSFDASFIRLLQQNGKATINSTASLLISNTEDKEFSVAFSPEYQNILKDEDHADSVDIGGDASLEAVISNAVITGDKQGVVNFDYVLTGSNVVERNNLGAEISENTTSSASTTLDFTQEKLLTSWERKSHVEQTIGVPWLCELPVLKYIFGTTTTHAETVHYIVTARAVPVTIHEDMKTGMMTEFDELAKNSVTK